MSQSASGAVLESAYTVVENQTIFHSASNDLVEERPLITNIHEESLVLAKSVVTTSEDVRTAVTDFLKQSCGCKHGDRQNEPCSGIFTVDEIIEHQFQVSEMDCYNDTHINPLNEAIVSQFSALCADGNVTAATHKP